MFKDFYKNAEKLRESLRSLFPNGLKRYYKNGVECSSIDYGHLRIIDNREDFTLEWWEQDLKSCIVTHYAVVQKVFS